MAGLENVMVLGLELSAVQVEATAAVVKRYFIPYHAQIEDFGFLITEDFVAQGTVFTIALKTEAKNGGASTTRSTLKVDATTPTLKKGDGTKAAQTLITAETDLNNGDVVYAKGSEYPIQVTPGQTIVFEVTVAGDSAGGAGIPFCRLRVSGPDYTKTTNWIEPD